VTADGRLGLTRVDPYPLATENLAQVAQMAPLAFGVLGLFLGGMPRAGWWAGSTIVVRGSRPEDWGSILGFAAGAGVFFGVPAVLSHLSDSGTPDNDLLISFTMHGAIWGPAGRSGWTGLRGRFSGNGPLWGRALIAGFAGALIGAFAFDLGRGCFAFPLAKTDDPISRTWITRLMARLLVDGGNRRHREPWSCPFTSAEPSGPETRIGKDQERHADCPTIPHRSARPGRCAPPRLPPVGSPATVSLEGGSRSVDAHGRGRGSGGPSPPGTGTVGPRTSRKRLECEGV